MVRAQRLLAVIFALLSMSAETSGAIAADADMRTPESSGFVNSSGTIQARDSEQFENDTTRGCRCDLNQCERFCCPRGHAYALDMNKCVEDTLTPRARDLEGSIKNHRVVSRVPNNYNGYMYRVHLQDSSACTGKWKRLLDDFAEYCLYRELNTTNYSFLGCTTSHLKTEDSVTITDYLVAIWFFACTGSAPLIALATFIVYCLVPELKNFQGRIIRSYLASYISCMILLFLTMIFVIVPPATAALICGVMLLYFGFACLFWMNVMSFDIWRTFRKIQSRQAVNVKDRQERATFVQYSIYAWGAPSLLIGIQIAIGPTSLQFMKLMLPISGIFVSNTCFYVLTALKIKQCKKETAQVVGEASKHCPKHEQWFNLYLRLFIIMGCPIILWAVSVALPDQFYLFLVVVTVEPLQAICVFYTFVWKEDVKRSIRKQFSGMMRRLGCCRQGDSTRDAENGVEQL